MWSLGKSLKWKWQRLSHSGKWLYNGNGSDSIIPILVAAFELLGNNVHFNETISGKASHDDSMIFARLGQTHHGNIPISTGFNLQNGK